ncbi:MAG: phosphatase [Lachnospiraceae bacterium]|nr:phosphatase [Lachnospiraceae bacterium]
MKYLMDLHTHSIAGGHAYSTVKENMEMAYLHGMKVYGLSEHAPAMPGGPHEFFFGNLKVLPKEYKGMRVLAGVEANIMDLEGTLDLSENRLKLLDYCIASQHISCVKPGSARENTDSLIKAMQNPYVCVIGHPDDSRYPLEYERLVEAARQYHVLLEVNNSSMNPLNARQNAEENIPAYLELCKKYQAPILLGTDAHYCDAVGMFDEADAILKQVDFPQELVVNLDPDRLWSYLKNLPKTYEP